MTNYIKAIFIIVILFSASSYSKNNKNINKAKSIEIIYKSNDWCIDVISKIMLRLRGIYLNSSDATELYNNARKDWLQATLNPDSSAPYKQQIQSVWTKKLLVPAPSIVFASFIIMLERKNIGAIGCKVLSASIADMVINNNGIILCETKDNFFWVNSVKFARMRSKIYLSDNTEIDCSNRNKLCQSENVRQWIFLFPEYSDACNFYNTVKRINNDKFELHLAWLPKFIMDYAELSFDKKNINKLLKIRQLSPCNY